MATCSFEDNDYERAARFMSDFHHDRHKSRTFKLDVIHEALEDSVRDADKNAFHFPRKLSKNQASTCLASLAVEMAETREDHHQSSMAHPAGGTSPCPEEGMSEGASSSCPWGHFIADDGDRHLHRGRKRAIPRHPHGKIVWQTPKRWRPMSPTSA
mmetsp:Transcript_8753/g.12387  ORF Transcript_8753/g.12387 Transcript_8753/m.12387 type:complete len:156 (+) Transcript_8753:275-742(+)